MSHDAGARANDRLQRHTSEHRSYIHIDNNNTKKTANTLNTAGSASTATEHATASHPTQLCTHQPTDSPRFSDQNGWPEMKREKNAMDASGSY